MHAIEVDNFEKSYGPVAAVRGISFAVAQGELFGLIGPDGAGKTTTMRAICTLLRPDAGIIKVQNLEVTANVAAIRSSIGYMPQRFSLYQDLTVEQNLRFFADIFQVQQAQREKRLADLYRFSKLGPFRKRKAGALSGGMKQKLALSCALIHTPAVLVLDEPTYGVDPVSRQEFWEILQQLRRQGTSILISTAYMDEADRCDRVGLMFRGRLVAVDRPGALKQSFPYPVFRIAGQDPRRLRNFFRARPEVLGTQLFGDAVHVRFKQIPAESMWRRWQQETEHNLQSWTQQQPTIEDIFLAHMDAA